MSAKTCQLCGKPMSRLWVGADPDFCSKEHRNQFRLRRGMDRLVEVNKVANLMRRRESPKQITFASLLCQSALAPRGFNEPVRTAIHTTPFNRQPSYAAFAQPRIEAHADDCIVPTIRHYSGQRVIRRPGSAKIRIRNQNSRPVLPGVSWSMRAKVRQAPPCGLHRGAPADPQRHEFRLLRPRGIRTYAGKGPAGLQRIPFPGREGLRQPVRRPGARSIAAAGKALRVSAARAFTTPSARLGNVQPRPQVRAGLVFPAGARQIVPAVLDCMIAASRILKAGTTAIALRLPSAPELSSNAEFRALRAMPPAMGSAMPGRSPSARSTVVEWRPSSARWRMGEIKPAAAGFNRRNGIRLRHLTVAPNGVASAPQIAFRPFIPQEPTGCPVVPFQAVIAGGASAPTAPAITGTLADLPDAPEIKAAPKPTLVSVRYEEHFDGGWDNWVGGVQDWLVDVAGVRTGSMALFMPTLDLSDYDLEFLGRIDARSINWVVRATGLDRHVRCTLTLREDNQLEFSRITVLDGTAQEAEVSSMRIPGKKRSAVTIRTSVSGSSIAVSVDGNEIDTWTEERLPSGGVGFVGAPDDRARLYWVKVSSQTSGKE